MSDLVKFHTQQKLLMMAHSPALYKQMGQLVANSPGLSLAQLLPEYEKLYMQALTYLATAKKHTNVLMHMMGYFKKWLCMRSH